MKIASFNANGIRARLPVVLRWLAEAAPDCLCLQETKVQDADFPKEPFEAAGYHCCFTGIKSYNGVAVLSKAAPSGVRPGFDASTGAEDARLIAVNVNGVAIVNTYIPQGQAPESEKFQYKLAWLERLSAYFVKNYNPLDPVLWLGDFNIAPEPIDVYDPEKLAGAVCFHPEEHRRLEKLAAWGFVDVYRRHRPDAREFSFWDYRIPQAVKRGLGWRIDHIWATAPLAARSTAAWIDAAPRSWQRPSDHTFVVAEFQI